jgi:hypothetical protein
MDSASSADCDETRAHVDERQTFPDSRFGAIVAQRLPSGLVAKSTYPACSNGVAPADPLHGQAAQHPNGEVA